MAAVTTSIAAETEAAATMEATTVPSSMHNLQLSECGPMRNSKMVYSSRWHYYMTDC